MSLGSGFLRALLAVLETRGAPWIMRGSFIKLVSSLAGAINIVLVDDTRLPERIQVLTSCGNTTVILREILLAAAARGKEGCVRGSPKVVGSIRQEVCRGSP